MLIDESREFKNASPSLDQIIMESEIAHRQSSGNKDDYMQPQI